MAKLVQIQINQADYDGFKSTNWNLCYARQVNNTYTVGQSISNYLPSARISWQSNYSVFGTNFFNPGAEAVVETNPVAIDFGQRAVLDAAGGPEAGRGYRLIQRHHIPEQLRANSSRPEGNVGGPGRR